MCLDITNEELKKLGYVKMSDLSNTLKERRNRYGEFSDNATIAQALKDIVRARKEWEGLDATQREAIDQIFAKISRVMTGDPDYPDNWHDMAGYSTLAEDHNIKKEKKEKLKTNRLREEQFDSLRKENFTRIRAMPGAFTATPLRMPDVGIDGKELDTGVIWDLATRMWKRY